MVLITKVLILTTSDLLVYLKKEQKKLTSEKTLSGKSKSILFPQAIISA